MLWRKWKNGGDLIGNSQIKITARKGRVESGDAERDWVDVMFESLAYDEERTKRIY